MSQIDQLIESMKKQAVGPAALAELAFQVAHASRIALSRISPEFDKLYLEELEKLQVPGIAEGDPKESEA